MVNKRQIRKPKGLSSQSSGDESGSTSTSVLNQKKPKLPFRCKICSVILSSKTAGKRHISIVHKDVCPKGTNSDQHLEELGEEDIPSQSTPDVSFFEKNYTALDIFIR